jgi:hypothetical protein
LGRGHDFEYAPQDEVKISKRAGIVKEYELAYRAGASEPFKRRPGLLFFLQYLSNIFSKRSHYGKFVKDKIARFV